MRKFFAFFRRNCLLFDGGIKKRAVPFGKTARSSSVRDMPGRPGAHKGWGRSMRLLRPEGLHIAACLSACEISGLPQGAEHFRVLLGAGTAQGVLRRDDQDLALSFQAEQFLPAGVVSRCPGTSWPPRKQGACGRRSATHGWSCPVFYSNLVPGSRSPRPGRSPRQNISSRGWDRCSRRPDRACRPPRSRGTSGDSAGGFQQQVGRVSPGTGRYSA